MRRVLARDTVQGMSSIYTPPPFDPPDLPIAFSALSSASRTALALLWVGTQASAVSQLLAIQAVELDGAVYRLTVRGYQLAAWGRAKGLL